MITVVLASKTADGEEGLPDGYDGESFTRLYIADGEPVTFPTTGLPLKVFGTPQTVTRPKVLRATTKDGETLNLASFAYYANDLGARFDEVDQKAWARQVYYEYLKKLAATKANGFIQMANILDTCKPKLPAPEPAPETTPTTTEVANSVESTNK